MSRFRADVYDKLFPRVKETKDVETAVSTFTPTKDKVDEMVDEVDDEVVDDIEGEEDCNGDGELGESDIEQ